MDKTLFSLITKYIGYLLSLKLFYKDRGVQGPISTCRSHVPIKGLVQGIMVNLWDFAYVVTLGLRPNNV